MPAADLEAGLVAFLKADAELAALVDDRVFGGELPAGQAANMPRKALVLRPSGGTSLTGDSHAEHDTQRVDLFGFGATPREASRVLRTASLAMRRMRRGVHGGVLLHSANAASGVSRGREPGTEWPREFQSFQIFHALEAVA